MSSPTSSKPSLEAKAELDDTPESTGIVTAGFKFASTEEHDDSLKESNKMTDIWTLSARFDSIEKVTPIPKLSRSDWFLWPNSVKRLVFLTHLSAAFLEEPPHNRAILMWSGWWAAKVKETATEIRTAPSDNPRSILNEIFSISESNVFSAVLSSTARFWNFQPENMMLSSYIKEYQKRYLNLKEHCPITLEINPYMKHLLLFHVQNMLPELANRCRDLSYDETISECLKWTSAAKSKGNPKRGNQITCNFCHIENDCRKKKRT
ncbi:hypothetical protein K3495_g1321 [Podosphaera aphanis]|nr:hypothetical protein K3495_g1321 [Podosphaera aphanis]